jgi:hypothetical protein
MKHHLLSALIASACTLCAVPTLQAETTTLSVPVTHHPASAIAAALQPLANDTVNISVFENKIYLQGPVEQLLALKASIREMDSPSPFYQVLISQSPKSKNRYSTADKSQTTGRYQARTGQWIVAASVLQPTSLNLSPFWVVVDKKQQTQEALAIKISPQGEQQALVEYQVVSRAESGSELQNSFSGSALVRLEEWTALFDQQHGGIKTRSNQQLYIWLEAD